MSSTLRTKVKLYLAFQSGGVCAHPECQVRLTQGPAGDDEGVIIGEAAHIFGEKPGSARFDPTKSIEFRNSAENLIYLCPNHHTLIDKQRETHTVDELIFWKSNHERKMRKATAEPSVEVTGSSQEYMHDLCGRLVSWCRPTGNGQACSMLRKADFLSVCEQIGLRA